MYLSKVLVEGTAARNPYEWHRALWRLFPGRPAGKRGFLFRVESQHPRGEALMLLQSEEIPLTAADAVRLVAQPKKLDGMRLAVGQLLRFRLTANPCKKIRDCDDIERKLRVPLVQEEEQVGWLARKLSGAAAIKAATVQTNPPLYFRKSGQAGKIVTVTFDGMLTVTDAEMLITRIGNGLGAAKSFGCGLLSVARV